MLAHYKTASGLIFWCNLSASPSPWIPPKFPKSRLSSSPISRTCFPRLPSPRSRTYSSWVFAKPCKFSTFGGNKRGGFLQICGSSFKGQSSEEDPSSGVIGNGGGGGRDWTTSILLLGLWAALMYYVFKLAPNQTPSRDMYFLQKLLNLKGDDGFKMNEVLVSLWYVLGLWPLVYSMMLLPTARSSKGSIPLWPFLILSFGAGAYALIPYFVLWRPPPPSVEETELRRWPLTFLESKVTASISIAAGLGLIIYAGIADGNVWKEFFQYFRESKFIHVSCVDFMLLSSFAPFWVFNDMTVRKWYDKGYWLLPVSLIPLLGPSLYLVLRPSLSVMPAPTNSTTTEEE